MTETFPESEAPEAGAVMLTAGVAVSATGAALNAANISVQPATGPSDVHELVIVAVPTLYWIA